MRKSYLAGLVLAVTAGLVVVVSNALDLELQSVALLGAAMGAVLALVPDRTPAARLGGFAAGYVLAWLGYVVRAAALPDTSAGHAVDVVLVVLLAVAVAAASRGRLPLWSLLVGLGTFAGAYEPTFLDDPTQVLSTSLSTATTLILTVGAGFLAASVVGGSETDLVEARDDDHHDHDHDHDRDGDSFFAHTDDLATGDAR